MKRIASGLLTLLLTINFVACNATGSMPPESAISESEGSAVSSEEYVNSQTHHYVLNTSSLKFHFPDCGSVKLMSDENRKDVEADRKDLIKQGYSPCGNCDP